MPKPKAPKRKRKAPMTGKPKLGRPRTTGPGQFVAFRLLPDDYIVLERFAVERGIPTASLAAKDMILNILSGYRILPR